MKGTKKTQNKNLVVNYKNTHAYTKCEMNKICPLLENCVWITLSYKINLKEKTKKLNKFKTLRNKLKVL